MITVVRGFYLYLVFLMEFKLVRLDGANADEEQVLKGFDILKFKCSSLGVAVRKVIALKRIA